MGNLGGSPFLPVLDTFMRRLSAGSQTGTRTESILASDLPASTAAALSVAWSGVVLSLAASSDAGAQVQAALDEPVNFQTLEAGQMMALARDGAPFRRVFLRRGPNMPSTARTLNFSVSQDRDFVEPPPPARTVAVADATISGRGVLLVAAAASVLLVAQNLRRESLLLKNCDATQQVYVGPTAGIAQATLAGSGATSAYAQLAPGESIEISSTDAVSVASDTGGIVRYAELTR